MSFYSIDRRYFHGNIEDKIMDSHCFAVLFYFQKITLWDHGDSCNDIHISWDDPFNLDVAYKLGRYFYDYVKAVQKAEKYTINTASLIRKYGQKWKI